MRRDSNEDFRVKLDAAGVWERALAKWARGRGWYVLPTDEFSGKGDGKTPKLLAPPGRESLIMPDLLGFREGVSQWLECKWKEKAVEYRIGR